MRLVFLYMTILFLAAATPAFAEQNKPLQVFGEVTAQPECFNIVSEAPYTVFGSVNTNFFVRPDGIKTRHKSNFRLEPESFAQFCTSGPFYEGHKVELVLRSLIPLFTCKTGIDGNIVIKGKIKPEGGTETWAECL